MNGDQNTRPVLIATGVSREEAIESALRSLKAATGAMLAGWTGGDPERQGYLWGLLKKTYKDAEAALEAQLDPRPGICRHVWLNQLDNCWDRCGLPLGHEGGHLPAYMMAKEEEQ